LDRLHIVKCDYGSLRGIYVIWIVWIVYVWLCDCEKNTDFLWFGSFTCDYV